MFILCLFPKRVHK